jgi:Rrf2 family protein
MLRLNKTTEYGLLIMGWLISQPHLSFAAKMISGNIGVDLPMTKKTLHQLQLHNFIKSSAGQDGGYTLACNPNKTTLLNLIQSIEGQPTLVPCVNNKHDCQRWSSCLMKQCWHNIQQDVMAVFSSYTLADLLKTHEPQEKAI